MKIGIVTTWFERGAAYVSKQFEEGFSINHDVFIYARGGEEYAIGNPKWDNENVTWGKRNLFSTPTQINIKHLKNWIKTNSIDLILFNEQHEWAPVIACSELDVITGAYIDYYKKETVPFFGIYDFLICNTKRHHSVFEWHPQSFYIPWGTDIELFSPQERNENSKKINFFHSCGMNPLRKGTDLLLLAFDKIDRKKAVLIIHSQINLKAFFPESKDLIDKFLDEKSLLLIERTVSAPGLYHLGDVYVYPSRLEGIGLTITEAISCGLPVVVTDEQPMSEFVQSCNTGRLVDVAFHKKREDSYYWSQSIVCTNSLASHMNFFIENKDQIKEFKKDSREYAEDKLDWKKNIKSFEGTLLSIKKNDIKNKEQSVLSAKHFEKNRQFKYKLRNSRLSIILKAHIKKVV